VNGEDIDDGFENGDERAAEDVLDLVAVDDGFSADAFGDGEELPADILDEFAAVADAESDTLSAAQTAIAEERERTRVVLDRYRSALLTAEPSLPPELVRGTTLEELDASLATARAAVGEIRAQLASEGAAAERGFPVGAPARSGPTTAGLSSSEKIRRGLEERTRG
jgi:hypothetical protein